MHRVGRLFRLMLPVMLLVMMLGSTAAQVAAGSDGLLAYWAFEGSGNIAEDTSGNGFDGTINGNVGRVAGVSGQALDFRGGNVRAPNVFATQPSTFTVMAWAKPRGLNDVVIFSQTQTGGGGCPNEFVALWIGGVPGGQRMIFQVFTQSGSPNNFIAHSAATPNANEWHHWAGTFDGSTVRLYEDYVLVASTAFSGTPCYVDTSVEIGRKFNGNEWNGLIDEVKIFNHALSAEEIAEESSSGKITICHISPGNPPKEKTISIGSESVFDHLAHGDSLGPCP